MHWSMAQSYSPEAALLPPASREKEINLHAYATPAEARERIADYIRYLKEERPHQGLDNMTPDDVYYRRKPLPEAA